MVYIVLVRSAQVDGIDGTRLVVPYNSIAEAIMFKSLVYPTNFVNCLGTCHLVLSISK